MHVSIALGVKYFVSYRNGKPLLENVAGEKRTRKNLGHLVKVASTCFVMFVPLLLNVANSNSNNFTEFVCQKMKKNDVLYHNREREREFYMQAISSQQ
jgi:hypothetical protein